MLPIPRNNLLVNPGIGARFRLDTVLTDLPLSTDKTLRGGCGVCVKACRGPVKGHKGKGRKARGES